MATKKFQAVKGTRDILPPDSALWNRVEQTARRVFATYGFGEIRLPIFEDTEVFARAVGADTDVVSKEMFFTFFYRPQPHLEMLRDEVLAKDVSISDYDDILAFDSLLSLFAPAVKEALKLGAIPRNNINGLAEAVLDGHWMKMRPHIRFDAWPPSAIVLDELGKLLTGIKEAAGDIQFEASLSLRPEATASVARAYIQHGMQVRPGLTKLYYIGPMFRRERPQKGRFRQFYQVGAEVMGQSDNPAIDAEVIEMLLEFISQSGLKEWKLDVNSIGCSECRPAYVEKLRGELQKVKDQLGPDSQRRIETNPLRVLDSKVEEEQAIIEKLPSILSHLCGGCREHFAEVRKELSSRGIKYELNSRLVRGLDYYMRTTFEITASGLGSQDAICGGGRYDGLIEILGGPPTKGIGFALGTDRLIMALEAAQAEGDPERFDAYVIWMGGKAKSAARTLTRKLRQGGAQVELQHDEKKLKKGLDLASKSGARFAVIIGDEEIEKKEFVLRDLDAGEQESLPEDAVVKKVSGK